MGIGLKIDKICNKWDRKTYLDKFEEEIPKDEKFKEAEINRIKEETIIVVTKEGYVYKITENEIKYVRTQDKNKTPALDENSINFTYNPSSQEKEWTNGDVFVTIESEWQEEYELQYSLDDKKWKTYIGTPVAMKENGNIYARLVNDTLEVFGKSKGEVKNIDRKDPKGATISFSKHEISQGETVTATVTQSDEGNSGINIDECRYAFIPSDEKIGTDDISKYSGKFTKETEDVLSLTCPTSGTYYLHVLSVDFAGNKIETISDTSVKLTVEIDLIRDGEMCERSPILAYNSSDFETKSQKGTGSYSKLWKFRLWWANGYDSLSAVYWSLPVTSEKATITAEYCARNDQQGVYADVYVFGAGISPTGKASYNKKPYSNIYGDGLITQYTGEINSSKMYTTTVTLEQITEPLYVGFAPEGPSSGAGDFIDVYVKNLRINF